MSDASGPQLELFEHNESTLAMAGWFRKHYEDPVHHCPVDSGDFVFIYGGPHIASQILEDQFSGEYPDDDIAALGEALDLNYTRIIPLS